jgi:acyl phosphate:glycerol-3-phosphate acyltransferase
MNMTLVTNVLFCVGTYFVAAMPTGFWLVKALHGIDLRTVGSGNTGATNVKRAAGNRLATIVLLLDFFKGLLPVALAMVLFPASPWLPVLVALVAVLAHSKSIYIGFAGGKSAATGLGCFFALAPWHLALTVAVIAFTTMRLSRYVSLGSITAGVVAPLLLWWGQAPLPALVYTIIASAYVIYLHKANIQRLLTGKENRLTS